VRVTGTRICGARAGAVELAVGRDEKLFVRVTES